MPSKHGRIRSRLKVINPLRSFFCGNQKRVPEMDDWMAVMKNSGEFKMGIDSTSTEFLGGHHIWHALNHARPTYCNVCTDALLGVTSHGLSCEICKYKVHKRCKDKAINNCKWTTLASVGKNTIEDPDGNISMPHQWIEGNLPVASKCVICDKTCGSVMRLQDWRCLWCKTTVHTACRPSISIRCPLGPARLSVVPPIALHSIGSDEAWDATRPTGCSPLLVFVNSKSGDNQGIKFLRRFKQMLNPAQVFDLIVAGPGPGLRLFRHFDPFRILVCSGDGSVGWVLSEIDRLGMHKQCQVGVLPLGTGNDLARVLGWGGSCDDDANILHLLEKYEKASTKMLDRWSIMTFERGMGFPCHKEDITLPDPFVNSTIAHEYEDSILVHIANILHSDQESMVFSAAEVLRETVVELALRICEVSDFVGDEELANKCDVMRRKSDLFIMTIDQERNFLESDENTDSSVTSSLRSTMSLRVGGEKGSIDKAEKDSVNLRKRREFSENKTIIARANSLKIAVRDVVEHAEKAVEEKEKLEKQDYKEKFRQSDTRFLTPDSLSSSEVSPCSSPILNITTISPVPDVVDRRPSQAVENIGTLPVPEGFLDSRRNSANSPQGNAPSDFRIPDFDAALIQQFVPGGENHLETVLETNNERVGSVGESSPSDDTTIQDTMLSPDTESVPSREKTSPNDVKNSASEIVPQDSAILDFSERFQNGSRLIHIDSENSDSYASEQANSDSMLDDISSLQKDLYSTIDADKLGKKNSQPDQDDNKFCTLAQFDNGSGDIGSSPQKSPKDRMKEELLRFSKLQKSSFDSIELVPSYIKELSLDDDKGSDLYSDLIHARASIKPKSPAIFVNPPSPSMSIKSKHNETQSPFHLKKKESMEHLTVEYPDGVGISPHGTRRISCGSLLKPTEVSDFLKNERSKSMTPESKKLPIINPLVRLPMWPNVSGGLISQALLANADVLCASVSPLMDPDETLLEGYFEKCVMNNYFGIGIDAKISLDFHHKREEHPEKCRSRAKNYMWYGVLGSKQWLQKTYKNLDQRVQLECDGQRIPLPSLQGIVVLNIPSFMGGTNFWGGTKEGDIFLAPSFDDRILEVVAVFGSMQMAASRLINLQHHRIAQCQNIQINILGDEGVPIQVDGEAWIQPPGIIRIIHKNRMQMLCRNRALESSLKAWEEKQRNTMTSASNVSTTTLTHSSRLSIQIESRQAILSSEEIELLFGFIEVANTLIKYVKLLIISNRSLESKLYHVAARTAVAIEKLHPNGKLLEGITLRPVVTEVVTSARQLFEDSCELLRDKAPTLKLREDLEMKLSKALEMMEQELRKCEFDERDSGLVYLQNVLDKPIDKKNRHRGPFWSKFRRNTIVTQLSKDMVMVWDVAEVGNWLESLGFGEYVPLFAENDVKGKELLGLARRDLRDMGITKVGHVKRIMNSIAEINGST